MSVFGILGLQVQHLRNNGIRHFVRDPGAQEHDAVFQQSTVNVVDPFFATAFFDNVRNEWHC